MKTIRSNKKGFRIHSPFVYNLVTNVLFPAADYYVFDEIEKLDESKRGKAQLKIVFRLLNHFQPDLVGYEDVFTEESLNILKTFNTETIFKQVNSDIVDNLKNRNAIFLILREFPKLDIQSLPEYGIWFLKVKSDRNKITSISRYLFQEKNGIILIELKNEDLVIFDKRIPSQHYVIK